MPKITQNDHVGAREESQLTAATRDREGGKKWDDSSEGDMKSDGHDHRMFNMGRCMCTLMVRLQRKTA